MAVFLNEHSKGLTPSEYIRRAVPCSALSEILPPDIHEKIHTDPKLDKGDVSSKLCPFGIRESWQR